MTRPGWWALALAASGVTLAAGGVSQARPGSQRPVVTVYKTPT
jgi:hypothetical protein